MEKYKFVVNLKGFHFFVIFSFFILARRGKILSQIHHVRKKLPTGTTFAFIFTQHA